MRHARSEVKKQDRVVEEPAEMKRLTVRVPGSTANLGPGFDTLGLAFKLYCNLTFELLDKEADHSTPLITLKGVIVKGLPKDQNNLIYTVLSNLWRNDPELLQRIRITIQSDIPLGKGLGSSAAAIMGSVWAAYAFGDETADNDTLLAKATELEGHADNVAAALLGGLVICGKSMRGQFVTTQKMVWPTDWCTIALVPSYVLSTKKSRSVLPKMVKHEDAVANVQRVALLLSAVINKDEDAMREALHDRLHEPYRLSLVPELGEVKKLLSDLPTMGTVLSGAGSSVLTIVNRRYRPQVLACLQEWASKQKAKPDIFDLEIDQEGLRVSYE